MSEENWLSRAEKETHRFISQAWEKKIKNKSVFPTQASWKGGQLQMSPCPQDGASPSVTAQTLPPTPASAEESKVKLNPIISSNGSTTPLTTELHLKSPSFLLKKKKTKHHRSLGISGERDGEKIPVPRATGGSFNE